MREASAVLAMGVDFFAVGGVNNIPEIKDGVARNLMKPRQPRYELLTAAERDAIVAPRRGATERGLLDLVREIRERQTNYFPFDMYTQLPLAYALLSAKLGNLASAEQELDRYISRLKVDDDASVKLKQLAREYAGNTTGAA
jgi:hypothetical protein